MSPVFGHGHLRLYLLRLLDESPKHGYELIQALSDRFGGTYSPSAGTIYPRLAKLEEDGLVTKTADGRKTVYSITDAGRAELDSRRAELDDIEAELSDSVRRLADEVRSGVDLAMRSLKADLASAAREARLAATEHLRGWNSPVDPTATPSTSSTSTTAAPPPSSEPTAPAHPTLRKEEPEADSVPTASTGSSSSPSRADVSAALRDADIALADFRQSVRTDLRKASSEGFDPELVARLKRRLTEVRSEFHDELARR
ncbi:PadR family transcriptional regulator [Herbiconiux sp. P15]|uniref:PadR family transcriptional regulator n=1 Tax=Herbiconiux liukaitaii TaxID=3342799 RepID=UPI0035BB0A7C